MLGIVPLLVNDDVYDTGTGSFNGYHVSCRRQTTVITKGSLVERPFIARSAKVLPSQLVFIWWTFIEEIIHTECQPAASCNVDARFPTMHQGLLLDQAGFGANMFCLMVFIVLDGLCSPAIGIGWLSWAPLPDQALWKFSQACNITPLVATVSVMECARPFCSFAPYGQTIIRCIWFNLK